MGASIQSQQQLAQELARTLHEASRSLAEELARFSSKPGQQPVQPKYKDVMGALVNEAKKAFMFYRSVCRTTTPGKYESALKPLLNRRANSQCFGNTPRNESAYYKQIQKSLEKLLRDHSELKRNDQGLLAVLGWAVRIAEYYQQHSPQAEPQPRQQLSGKGAPQQAIAKAPGASLPARPPVDPAQKAVDDFIQRVNAVAPKDAPGILPNLANQIEQLPADDNLKRQAARAVVEKAERDTKKLEGKRWFQRLRAFLEGETQD
ncbi:MAG: hypothetical protein MI924_20910 [Chloroflexales bacterium]|nr:hypothetical protein [Chloroflexales bacterium]